MQWMMQNASLMRGRVLSIYRRLHLSQAFQFEDAWHFCARWSLPGEHGATFNLTSFAVNPEGNVIGIQDHRPKNRNTCRLLDS